VRTFTSGKLEHGDFLHALLSPRGDWLFCTAEDGSVYCFDTQTGNLEHTLQLHDKEPLGASTMSKREMSEDD
jgi:WD40 repeat-containing protein SMU1